MQKLGIVGINKRKQGNKYTIVKQGSCLCTGAHYILIPVVLLSLKFLIFWLYFLIYTHLWNTCNPHAATALQERMAIDIPWSKYVPQ